MQKQKTFLSIGLLIGLLFAGTSSYAEDANLQEENLPQAIEAQIQEEPVGLFPILDQAVDTPVMQLAPAPNPKWEISPLETFGVRWVIRAKEALNWTLNIKASSNHNPAIQATYNKVLSIVNSLFVIGLLAIAGMWMFSLLIPRKQLKRVMLIFAGAVIFVNFALPFNQLLVDTTQVLQKTLLTGPQGTIMITDLIQTPDYTQSIVYENKPDELTQGKTITHELKINPSTENTTGELPFATVHTSEKTLIGSLIQGNELGQVQFNIPESKDETLQLNTQEGIVLEQTVENTGFTESQVFSFGLMMATGTAYFAMAMVLVLRLVMLWALLILSPALLLLAIFNSTRGWFLQWVGVYGRWLMIGPLLALGLSVIINLWQLTGSPVEVNPFSGQTFIENPISTLAFYLPGRSEPNTLANTSQVMDYLLFLVMLYVPLFFAFALTRQKAVHAIGNWLKSYGKTLKKSTTVIVPTGQNGIREEEHSSEEKHSFVERLQETVSHKVKQFTQAAMPAPSIQSKRQEEKVDLQKTLMAALPLSDLMRQIKIDSPKKGNEMVTENKTVLEKLAFPERTVQNQEHQQLMSIRQEIEKRAEQGHGDAKEVWANIQAIENQNPVMGDSNQNNTPSQDWNFHEQPSDQVVVEHKETTEVKREEKIEAPAIEKETELNAERKTTMEEALPNKVKKEKQKTQMPEKKQEKKEASNQKEEEQLDSVDSENSSKESEDAFLNPNENKND